MNSSKPNLEKIKCLNDKRDLTEIFILNVNESTLCSQFRDLPIPRDGENPSIPPNAHRGHQGYTEMKQHQWELSEERK